MTEVTAKSYTLYTENGGWLAQIVLTSDGFFASVTDYGNLSYTWRSIGYVDFRKFLCSLNEEYFAAKMATGLAYIIHGKKIDAACRLFAKMILPPLQRLLKEELEKEQIPTA